MAAMRAIIILFAASNGFGTIRGCETESVAAKTSAGHPSSGPQGVQPHLWRQGKSSDSLLLAVAAVSAFLPARQATRVDPGETLRME